MHLTTGILTLSAAAILAVNSAPIPARGESKSTTVRSTSWRKRVAFSREFQRVLNPNGFIAEINSAEKIWIKGRNNVVVIHNSHLGPWLQNQKGLFKLGFEGEMFTLSANSAMLNLI
jgi:hypothetical protein